MGSKSKQESEPSWFQNEAARQLLSYMNLGRGMPGTGGAFPALTSLTQPASFFDKQSINPLLAEHRTRLGEDLDRATAGMGGRGLISSSQMLGERGNVISRENERLNAMLFPMRQQEFARTQGLARQGQMLPIQIAQSIMSGMPGISTGSAKSI